MEGVNALGLAEAAAAIRDGKVSSEELVKSCLDRIAAFEPEVEAWAHLDPDVALEQARAIDNRRYKGQPIGPLGGVPVGVKDIFDTVDYPTEYGSPIYAGRQTMKDAACVARLREAGAVIMGKTVTTEFAVYRPGKTKNPHDPTRTPGGSSSGSAASVAAFMVPGAVGTQTNGSVVRPASFCGVVGYKPSFGLISRAGALKQSPPLDQVGTFGRSVADAALLAEAIIGFDPADLHTRPAGRPALFDAACTEVQVPPRLAFVKSPAWDQAEDGTKEAFAELCEFLGDRCDEVEIAEVYDEIFHWHSTVMEADLAKNFGADFARAPEKFSAKLTEMVTRGQTVLATDYNIGIDRQADFERGFDALFQEYDAILTPSTGGEAPVGLDATGSPAFCTLWTFTGQSAITLPLMQGPAGMPLGVQLVGQKGDDARLMRTAAWLTATVEAAE